MFVLSKLPDDLSSLWAYVTFYGGDCQLNLNKKVTHLVVKEPKGVRTQHNSRTKCFYMLSFRFFFFLHLLSQSFATKSDLILF